MMLHFELKFVIMKEPRLEKILKGKKVLSSIKEVISKLEEDGGILEGVAVPAKENPAQKPVHEEEDIQEYKSGHKTCVKCDREFLTSTQLQRHLDKYHRYLYSFTCATCQKELTTKQGLKEHMLTHQDKEREGNLMYLCPNCGKEFKLKRSRNQHVKQKHEDYGPMNCQFGCGRLCYVKKNIVAHEKACSKNPDMKVFKCPTCGEEKIKCQNMGLASHLSPLFQLQSKWISCLSLYHSF